MKKSTLSLLSLSSLVTALPALADDSANAASIWSRLPGSVLIAAGALLLALVAAYRWRSKKQLPASPAAAPGGVTIVPASSKPKHGTEGVCCGGCSD